MLDILRYMQTPDCPIETVVIVIDLKLDIEQLVDETELIPLYHAEGRVHLHFTEGDINEFTTAGPIVPRVTGMFMPLECIEAPPYLFAQINKAMWN